MNFRTKTSNLLQFSQTLLITNVTFNNNELIRIMTECVLNRNRYINDCFHFINELVRCINESHPLKFIGSKKHIILHKSDQNLFK